MKTWATKSPQSKCFEFFASEPERLTDFKMLGTRLFCSLDRGGRLCHLEIEDHTVLQQSIACNYETIVKGEPTDATPIGNVEWTVSSNYSESPLGSGLREFAIADISIDQADLDLCTKELELGCGFTLLFCDDLKAKGIEVPGLRSFALSVRRRDLHMFSWNWFESSRPNKASPMNGEGLISYSTHRAGGYLQLARMDFIEDTVIRAKLFVPIRDIVVPEWSITIRAGSSLCLPALIDGKVVLAS